MGDDFYDDDVASRTRSTRTEAFQRSTGTGNQRTTRTTISPILNPHGVKKREARDSADHPNTTPIVVIQDGTLSRGEDFLFLWQKLPMFIGQMYLQNYVPHPVLSLAVVGDMTDKDRFPLQVSQFEADNRLDVAMEEFIIEKGGGGSGQESYELAAYFYATRSELDANKRGEKGFCFIFGDERFYEHLDPKQLKELFGDDIDYIMDSKMVFDALQEKYHVFFIYTRKAWAERKAGIDEEIAKRVRQFGGRVDDVEMGFSLIWPTQDDLDLRVTPPSGEEIYYGHKRSRCGGELDVDKNANPPYTTKPVENTVWVRGTAPAGRYRVVVQNYAYHSGNYNAVPFKVQKVVNGDVEFFEGKTKAGSTGPESNVLCFDFDYDPRQRPVDDTVYAAYDDQAIIAQWASVLPHEHVMIIDDPRAGVDLMLGAMALKSGSADLRKYMADMEARGQDEERITVVSTALSKLASASAPVAKIDASALPDRSGPANRRNRTTRI
ncbi:hypothetical protein HGA34_00130 [Candidatus Falkowbacteria bacterium]|nr:hypothetical protein [Candidatus Falkowbacteria bacterium]